MDGLVSLTDRWMMNETIGLMHGETNGWVHNEWVDEWMENSLLPTKHS